MTFHTWYVIFILGFASGMTVTVLWGQAATWIAEIAAEIRNRPDKPKNHRNGGYV